MTTLEQKLPMLPGPETEVQVSAATTAHLAGKLALLIIDPQKRFGSFPTEAAIMAQTQHLAPKFRAAAIPIFAIHFTGDDEPGAKDPSEIDFHHYKPEEGDRLVRKKEKSAFLGSNIDVLLKERGITHLLVAGVYLNQCVDQTVRHAIDNHYEVTLLQDLVSPYDPAIIAGLKEKGAEVEKTSKVLAAIKAAKPKL